MTVADKRETWFLYSKQLQGMGSGMVPLNWALCYKIEGII
jgi:hypothetical protein